MVVICPKAMFFVVVMVRSASCQSWECKVQINEMSFRFLIEKPFPFPVLQIITVVVVVLTSGIQRSNLGELSGHIFKGRLGQRPKS